ncbi:Formylglycine-generating enzyme [Phytophthora ramorum]|uniref:Formylglycine-generating enzyme n=1 Tax=Phytophthora ramorum TaxID=164328 RepID=UPI0030A447D0|nr:Formylglycine-generating enzyme [Phytophthora ramorum]
MDFVAALRLTIFREELLGPFLKFRCSTHVKSPMRVSVGLYLSAICCFFGQVLAWDQQPDGYEVIDGPDGPEALDAWRQDWATWKKMELVTNRYDAKDACNVYNVQETQWTQQNFVQTFLMMTDRSIYDRETQQYTVDKYVDEMEKRVGTIDSVLIWPAYPNIGIDNRNQWDLLRDLPGGVDGVKGLIADFHRRGVKVIIPYNPWDIGTRDEFGLEDMVRMYNADMTTLNEVVPELQADGFNGDTMYGVPKAFYNCSKPLVATPEGGVPTAFLSNNPMSWGYFFGYSHFPPVARAKFLETRHMVQICARWSLDKTAELLTAFFNGAGYVVWENVWGIWNAMTEREDETAKRMFAILRKFGLVVSTGEWTPYYALKGDGLFASAFSLEGSGETLYTVISTAQNDKTFELPLTDAQLGGHVRVYDVYHGVELQSQNGGNNSDGSFVQVTLEPRGFGAILVTKSSDDLAQFLNEMQAMTTKSLSKYSTTRNLLQQQLVRNSSSVDGHSETGTGDDDMVRVSGTANWWFNVSGVQIEPVAAWTPNAAQFGTGVQFPWEHRPWNNHSTRLFVQDFLIDKHPVTNAQYLSFLKASGYSPKSVGRFLLHWENREGIPASWSVAAGLEQSPVVHVSREDADAYASFYGKRLPHDWEWQYVASNGENYDAYPWGPELDSTRLPKVSLSKELPTLGPIGSHESSRSTKFLVEDLVGYVWQMTDQFCDTHTCGLLLRGGSSYHPISATHSDPNWYFPQALDAQHHNRFLMISEDYDRSAMVGFRCAKSISPSREFDVVA